METFRDIEGYALWAKVGVIAFTAISVVGAVFDVVELGRVDTALDSGPTAAELLRLDSIDRTRAGIELLGIAVFLGAAIIFMIWFYAAYRNIVALGATNLRRSTGWAIGAWFIPLLNLIWPKEITNDTWRGSEPTLPPGYGNAWTQVKVPVYIHWWWGFYLASGVLSGVGSNLISAKSRSFNGTTQLELMKVGLTLDVVSVGGYIAACVLVVRLINEVTQRQRRRFTEIGLPTGYAPPVGAPAPGWGPPVAAPPMPTPPAEPGDDFRPRPSGS